MLMPSVAKRFMQIQNGATAIEYAFLAAMIATVIAVAVLGLGTNLKAAYQTVSDSFKAQ